MYATDELINNPDIAIAAFTALKEEKEKAKKLAETIAVKEQQISELRPKASYYDVVLNCKDLVSITDMKQVEETRKALSSSEVARGGYDAAIKKYGRVPVAICTAATIYMRKERLGGWGFLWAQNVLALWTNRPPSGIDRAAIMDDTLHPTRICDYSARFIRLTTIDD